MSHYTTRELAACISGALLGEFIAVTKQYLPGLSVEDDTNWIVKSEFSLLLTDLVEKELQRQMSNSFGTILRLPVEAHDAGPK